MLYGIDAAVKVAERREGVTNITLTAKVARDHVWGIVTYPEMAAGEITVTLPLGYRLREGDIIYMIVRRSKD